MKQVARLRYLRMAPRKVRLVAGLLRGLHVTDAEAQLLHEVRRAAKPLLKLLRSAVASAKAKKTINADILVVESLLVDQGPMLHRSLPRARGSASEIQKKMSHITLTLAEKEGARTKFSIVTQKKKKTPEGENRPRRKKEVATDSNDTSTSQSQKPFWRKMFNRKAV